MISRVLYYIWRRLSFNDILFLVTSVQGLVRVLRHREVSHTYKAIQNVGCPDGGNMPAGEM